MQVFYYKLLELSSICVYGRRCFTSIAKARGPHATFQIDLIAATSTHLDEQEVESLKLMHEDIALKEKKWDDRLEVAYISVEELKRYNSHYQQPLISPGEPFHVTEVGVNWVINRFILREQGIVVYGPSPVTLVDPISREELIQAVRMSCEDWREYIELPEATRTRKSQAFAILTMCRALYTLKHGVLVSKKEAALWVEKNLTPEWSSLIRRALAWREAWLDEPVDHAATIQETLQFVRFALSRCLE